MSDFFSDSADYTMKELILLSSSFPLYSDESFLEMEYAYLAEKFDKIDFVIVTNSASLEPKASKFGVHDVLEMRVNTTGKLKMMLSGFFSKMVWRELMYIVSTIQLRYFFSALKVAIVGLENAKIIRRVLEDKLAASKSSETVIYSYWGDVGAIAAAKK